MSADRSMVLAAAGYLAVVAALLHRLLLGEVLSPSANLWAEVPFRGQVSEDLSSYLNGIQGDVWRTFEPWQRYQHAAVREGRFPLWNPHVYCGFPFHANAQSAMLSPFQWLYFVCDPKWAVGVVAAVKLWLTGFAAFCLGRRLGLVPSGAFLAGAAWMLCAFNVRWLLWCLSSVSVLLPVLLVALDALLERPNPRRLALAGLAAAMVQLSGHPETQFHLGVLSGIYVLVRVFQLCGRWPDRGRRVLLCLGAHVLGLCAAAAALLPFLEQMQSSVDWHEATHARSRMLPIEGLLGAIAPDHFGRPRAGRFYQGPLNYVEAGLYIGLLPLALSMSAVLRFLREPRRTRAGPAGSVSVICCAWLLFCLPIVLGIPGSSTLLGHVPLFSKADNLRLLLGVQFAGAMLAGAAWTKCALDPSRFAAWSILLLGGAAVLGLGILISLRDPNALYSHLEGLRQIWLDPTVPAPSEHRSLRTLVSFGFALANCVWCICLFRTRLPGNVVQEPHAGLGPDSAKQQGGPRGRTQSGGGLTAWLFVLVLGDLFWVAYGFNPAVPARVVFPDPPAGLRRLVDNLDGSRLIATDEILSPNLAMVYGFRDLRGYDFPLDERWANLFRRLGWSPGITLLPRRQVDPCVLPEVQSVLDKCCVRFLYTAAGGNGSTLGGELRMCEHDGFASRSHAPWRLVQRGLGSVEDSVYQNPSANPRAYLAKRVTLASSEAALDALLNVSHDFRNESFVEQPIGDLFGSVMDPRGFMRTTTVSFGDDGDAADPPEAECKIERDAAEEVVIRTRSTRAGLLVLADRFDPNWQVELDGQSAQSVRANYLFRGVLVPAGEHVVHWTYRPRSFQIGLIISALSLLSLLTCLIWKAPRAGPAGA